MRPPFFPGVYTVRKAGHLDSLTHIAPGRVKGNTSRHNGKGTQCRGGVTLKVKIHFFFFCISFFAVA